MPGLVIRPRQLWQPRRPDVARRNAAAAGEAQQRIEIRLLPHVEGHGAQEIAKDTPDSSASDTKAVVTEDVAAAPPADS